MTQAKNTKAKRRGSEMSTPALEFKGGRLTLMMLHVYSTDPDVLRQQLDEKIAQAPGLFENAPIVLDLGGIRDQEQVLDLNQMIAWLRAHGLSPLGVRGGNELQRARVPETGLVLLPETRGNRGRREPEPEAACLSVEGGQEPVDGEQAETVGTGDEVYTPAKLITQPVRSGQQVVAKNGDLIVLSMVSRGAEILAAGNIHVYGPLRGRALAGVGGDTQTRIFCQALDAELVAVAGQYQISEGFESQLIGKPAQVYLEGDQLKIASLSMS